MVYILLVQAVGGPALHRLRVGFAEHRGAAVLADIFGVVAEQAVALPCHAVLQLAGRGELEALLDAALRLELGHFRLLCAAAATSWNSHGSPRWPGGSVLPKLERSGAYRGGRRAAQGG